MLHSGSVQHQSGTALPQQLLAVRADKGDVVVVDLLRQLGNGRVLVLHSYSEHGQRTPAES
ncbi:hypothetical protein GCM10010350_72680 [Streptomyces galilaeus]|nr:hypothetical protein GCM10010350_72680 [Streptomyces galilaeus]